MKRMLALFVFIITVTNSVCYAMEENIEKTRQSFDINKISYAFMQGGTATYASDDYTYLSGSVAKGFAAELILRLKSAKILTGNEEKYGYTINDILNHQNSLTPYTGSLAGFTLNSRDEILNILKIKEKKDCSFNYQNITFLILEEIIEEKTGQPYREVLKEYLLNPLQLYSSGSGYDDFCTRWNFYPPTIGLSAAPDYFCRAVCAYEAAAGIFCSAGNLMRWAGYIYSTNRLSGFAEKGVKIDSNLYYYNGWYIQDNIAYSNGTVIGGGAVCAFDMATGNGISLLASGDSAPLVSLALEYFKEDSNPVLEPDTVSYPLPSAPSYAKICGIYQNDLYGALKIDTFGTGYRLTLGSLSSPIKHVFGNVYTLTGINESVFKILPGIEYIYFDVDSSGCATAVTVESVFTEGSGVFVKTDN